MMNKNFQIEIINLYYNLSLERKNLLDGMEKVLGSSLDSTLFEEELEQLEKLIVQSFGGKDEHHDHISTCGLCGKFFEFTNDHISTEDLIEYIENTIKNDWKEEGTITIISG